MPPPHYPALVSFTESDFDAKESILVQNYPPTAIFEIKNE
jgi:hypothetical protein